MNPILPDKSVLDNTQSDIIAILGAHGARFTLIPTRSKAPRYAGWQHVGKTTAEAQAHAQAGGNVGLLCGSYSGGLIVIDADKAAPALEAAFPILTQTVKTWRADAPDRAKWIIRVDGALPSSKKDHDAGLEILADVSSGGGSNAVVAGVHDKGATIQHTGSTIATMTAADLAEIWRWRTGTELDAGAQAHKTRQHRSYTGASAPTPARAAGATDPANVAVRRFNRENRITDVMQRLGYRWHHADRWVAPQSEHGTPSCQVNERAGHVWHYSTKNVTGREGKATAADLVCAHDFGGNADRFLASLTPATATTEPAIDWTALKAQAATMDIRPHVAARLAQLAELAVKEAEAAAAAYAANPTDQTEAAALALRKSADKLIAQAANPPHSMLMKLRRLIPIVLERFEYADHKYGQLDGIRIPVGGVVEKFKGEDATREYLNLLEGWLLTPLHKVRGRAAKYAVNVAVFREVGHIISVDDQTSREMTTLVAQITHPGHDAFRRPVTPRRRTGFQYMLVAATADAIRNGYNVEPLPGESLTDVIADGPRELRRDAMPDEKTRHMQAAGYLHEQTARLAADLASIGDAGVSLVTHLQQAGGLMSGSDLALRLDKMDRFAFSKLVKRCIVAGIVRKPDRRTVELLPDWADNLDASVKSMPTYADSAIATARHLDMSEAYQTERLNQAAEIAAETQDKTTYAQMELRIRAIHKTLATLQNLRMALIVWAAETLSLSHPHKATRIFKRYASKAERDAVDQANRAAAGRRRLHSIETAAASKVGYLRSWELPEDAIVAKLMLAGYSGHTITEVLR
jgi:hypothetical protein